MNKKIGILLGSFDPIHMGHLYMATSALNNGLVNEVVFVPSVQNPWKKNSSGFRNRCIMVQLAIDELEHCQMSCIDHRTSAPHYTSNTLKLLKEQYPNDELCIIVGADVAPNIKDWYEGEWILENFQLITVSRPGCENDNADISMMFDISSSYIRDLVKNGKQVYPLVPKVVSQCIKRFGLYE